MTTVTRPMTNQEAARYAMLREKFAGRPDVLLEVDADIARQLSRPAPLACPSWCDETNHDGYGEMSGDDAGRQMLSHSMTVSDGVFIAVDEYRDADDIVTRDSPFIHTYSDGQDLTAAGAAAYGEALLMAAAKLREIDGAA